MIQIRFAQPEAFFLLLIIPAVVAVMIRARKSATPKMLFSSIRLLGGAGSSWRVRLRPVPSIMSLAALVLLIVALARPQSPWREHQRQTSGIDIMLVTDVSESMRALDFSPNRLEKAKAEMKEFVAGRTDDQIGIVIFAKETFSLCPLTHDYAALETFIDRIDFDLVDGQATAIGMGLANAVNKLKDSPSKSKVIILLTDGENNFGTIHPLTAAEIAKQLNVRTYTIGIGSRGLVRMPVQTAPGGRRIIQRMQSQIDTVTLEKIAEMTGGKFFEATDGSKLEGIYAQIDEMERTEIEYNETNYFDELAHFLIVPALLLVAFAFFLEQTWLWSFP